MPHERHRQYDVFNFPIPAIFLQMAVGRGTDLLPTTGADTVRGLLQWPLFSADANVSVADADSIILRNEQELIFPVAQFAQNFMRKAGRSKPAVPLRHLIEGNEGTTASFALVELLAADSI